MWEIDSGSSLTRSSREPSGALAAIDAAGTDGFTLADLHGNLAAVVNAAETAYLSAVRYDSYGQTAATYDAGGSFPSPWGFQSRLDVSPDAANPLYEFGARFYAPATGAFTQLDSYAGSPGDPLSLNRYLYAAANPWTLVDPTGHKFEMGAGTGTMTTTEYHHYVASQVAAAQATKRAAVQQRREAAMFSTGQAEQRRTWWTNTSVLLAAQRRRSSRLRAMQLPTCPLRSHLGHSTGRVRSEGLPSHFCEACALPAGKKQDAEQAMRSTTLLSGSSGGVCESRPLAMA